MLYVRVTSVQESVPTNVLDPTPYLQNLISFKSDLPEGARAFASDPDHYDFTSMRCVKDLRIESIVMRESGNAQLGVEIVFAPNQFKHTAGLVIRYEGVTKFNLEATSLPSGTRVWPETRRLGDVQLDEVLPSKEGCSHEIKFTGGSILVLCDDLSAKWNA